MNEIITDKKLDAWNYALDNFQAEGELTVTITLYEYRQLVKDNAIANYKIDQTNQDKYKRVEENEALKKRVKELEQELFELRCSIEQNNAQCVKVNNA